MLPFLCSLNCRSCNCDYTDRADNKQHKNVDLSRATIKLMSDYGTGNDSLSTNVGATHGKNIPQDPPMIQTSKKEECVWNATHRSGA